MALPTEDSMQFKKSSLATTNDTAPQWAQTRASRSNQGQCAGKKETSFQRLSRGGNNSDEEEENQHESFLSPAAGDWFVLRDP